MVLRGADVFCHDSVTHTDLYDADKMLSNIIFDRFRDYRKPALLFYLGV